MLALLSKVLDLTAVTRVVMMQKLMSTTETGNTARFERQQNDVSSAQHQM